MRLPPRTMASLIVRSGAAVIISPVLSAPVFAQAEAAVDVSVQGTAASSPSLGGTGGDGAVSVGLQIDPSIYYQDGDVTTAAVRGTLSVEQYSGSLGTAASMSLAGNVQHRLSDTTLVGVNASLSSTRSAVRDFLRRPAVASDVLQGFDPDLLDGYGPQAGIAPGPTQGLEPQLVDPQFPDVIEEGLGGRTTSSRFGGSVSHKVSPLDSLSLTASVRFSESEDTRAADYRAEDFSAFYTRKLSGRASVDVGLSGGQVNYDESQGQARGDGSFVTPTVALSFRVSEAITSSMALGASITRVKDLQGQSVTHTGLAGRFELCRLQYRETLCANASRSVQPTSFAGLTTVTSAGLTYGRALGLKQRMSLAAAYTRRNANLIPGGGVLDDTQSLFVATARYTRKIGERLDAFVSPSYAHISGGLSGGRQNYQVSFGIRYRLGRVK